MSASPQLPGPSGPRSARLAGYVDTAPSPPTFIGFLVLLLRDRRLVLRVLALSIVVALLWALLPRREYTARSSFTPQTQRNPMAGMAGLAAQLGVALPANQNADNPNFYAALAESKQILGAAAETTYPLTTDLDAPRQNLIQVYGIDTPDSSLARFLAVKKLAKKVSTSVDPRTGVVSLAVTAKSAALAQAINQRLLNLLSEFNMVRRQSQAGAERAFAERRLGEVKASLNRAEEKVTDFLKQNRSYVGSPELQFQHERLMREVTGQQTLYNLVLQMYEQAKLDEVRDTPVLTVVERPEIPARPDSRGFIKKGAFCLIVGLLTAIALAVARAQMRPADSTAPADAEELRSLWTAARADWRRSTRWFRRARPA